MNKNDIAFSNAIYDIGGVKTNVHIGGEGEPLLWFHGSGGLVPNLTIYKELVEQYKVYLVDHPGFGYSERPDWFVDYDDYNYFYRDFLNYFSLDKVNIIGHSLGGRVAVEFAISHPFRVNKLVLISAAGLDLEGVKRPDIFMMSPEDSKRVLFYDDSYTEQLLLKEPTEEEQEISAKNIMTVARLNWQRNYNPKLPRMLRYIEAPTCIIWGVEDELMPIEHARVYETNIDGAVLHELDKCGHMPHIEREEKCTQIIKSFL